MEPTLVGRSSSHFTRVARIFAAEAGVAYAFEVVPDLLSSDAGAYAGNPALRVPILRSERGVWFGSLGICRELVRLSERPLRVVWPEHCAEPVLANTQELVVQAMSTEVSLILAKLSGSVGAHLDKARKSLTNTMSWLEENAARALDALPERDVSYLEVSLFCLVTHLEFRDVLPTAGYPELTEFCRRFAARASAGETAYRFDS